MVASEKSVLMAMTPDRLALVRLAPEKSAPEMAVALCSSGSTQVELALAVARDVHTLAQVGREQVGADQDGAGEVAAAQVGADQAGVFQVGLAEVASEQGRAVEPAAGEVGAVERRAGKVGVRQVLPGQVKAGQVHAGEHCAAAARARVPEQAMPPQDLAELSLGEPDLLSMGRVRIHACTSIRPCCAATGQLTRRSA